jgi:hypothetical protein
LLITLIEKILFNKKVGFYRDITPNDHANVGGSHQDWLPSKQGLIGFAALPMDAGVEFMDRFHECRAMILYHIRPTLGIQ